MDTQRAVTDGIKVALRLRGKRRTELARVIDKQLTTVNSKCAGQSRWSLDEVLEVSQWLGISIADLVRGADHVQDTIAWQLNQEARERRQLKAASLSA